LFQVVDDAAAGAHAGSGDDDGRAGWKRTWHPGACFSTEMGDGDGFWDHGVATGVFSDRMGQSVTIGRLNIVCFLNYV